MISMIAAIGEGNRVLGKDNKLVWDILEDTKFFRDTTRGHPVIMGRKTFDSLGRPLPKRVNIVVTRDKNWKQEGVIVCHTLSEALDIAKGEDSSEIFIIGGGQIYKEALPFANRLYLTIVHGNFEGDAFFPEYQDFTKIISQRESEGNGYKYTFFTLERA